MKVFFLSDQHLTDPNEEKCQTLLRFFNGIRSQNDCSHLFLVGDIFDLWVGKHDYFVKRWQPFNAELLRLVNLGVQVHYFEGNHDLYLKQYFYRQLGVQVHTTATYFQIGGKTLRVEHGDQMDPEDKGYLFLRAFLRSKFIDFVNRKAPGVAIAKLGEWASSQSRKHHAAEPSSADADRIRKLTDVHVKSAHAGRPFDIFVAGHFHLKDQRQIEVAAGRKITAFNLGFQEPPLELPVKQD